MNRRILIQVAAPAVVIGLAMTAVCMASAWYFNRLQTRLAGILAENVSSMQAAQELMIAARQMRFHCFLLLLDGDPAILQAIDEDERQFEHWLDRAEQMAFTPIERVQVRDIRAGYHTYRTVFNKLRSEVGRTGRKQDYRRLAAANPIRGVLDSCRQYLETNEATMNAGVQESSQAAQRLQLLLLLLAVGGPLGGLLSGFGIARGLSRSLYRLSVRVQDMAQQLDRDVAAVQLTADGDLRRLDAQLDHVVARVAEVAQRLQQQQRDMLRAQQLAAVGQLAASVAHEVRNPLTSIKLLVEASLRPHRPKPLTAATARVVHGEVLRLEQTVQSFLDFARPPALRRHREDLRDVAKQAVELVRARAHQQQVTLDAGLPEEPVLSDVDAGQLRAVLVNLLVNALDAMPGGGRLSVTLDRASPAQARLRVTDTGTGFAPTMLDQLFTPFVSTKSTGSGLGLSISKRIIEEHGGTIAADNRPTGGACLTVTLPATINGESYAGAAGN